TLSSGRWNSRGDPRRTDRPCRRRRRQKLRARLLAQRAGQCALRNQSADCATAPSLCDRFRTVQGKPIPGPRQMNVGAANDRVWFEQRLLMFDCFVLLVGPLALAVGIDLVLYAVAALHTAIGFRQTLSIPTLAVAKVATTALTTGVLIGIGHL